MDDNRVVTRDWENDINPYIVVYKHTRQIDLPAVDIKVMSWNISGLICSPIMLEGILQTIAEVTPAIIMLQEVSRLQVDALRERFDSLYAFHIADADAQHTCILGARCPGVLSQVRYRRFPNTADSRGMFTATFTFSGKSVRLVTTHLESGAQAHGVRCEQFAEVLAEDAHILAGDFNIRDTEIQQNILDRNWHDSWIVSGQDETRRYTWDAHKNSRIPTSFFSKPRFRFDRCFVRKDDAFHILDFTLITSKFQETFPSDHFALVVSLRLR
jgi:endonuclease/exonuclease/phosphatase family metal-dependent hydrolase